jgi:hypothetical protein
MILSKPKRFLLVSLFVGWFFDFMFAGKNIGISFFLFILVALIAGNYLAKSENIKPQARTQWLLIPILYFSSITFIRIEPFTVFMNMIATLILLGIYAHTFRKGNWFLFNFIQYIKGAIELFFNSLHKQLIVFYQQRKIEKSDEKSKPLIKNLLPILRGILITVPILIIFASLLMEADPIFEQKVFAFTSWINFEKLIEYIFRLFVICLVGYFISGIFIHAFIEKEQKEIKLSPAFQFLGYTEASIVLGSVIVLFSTFVFVQFQYFFGGNQSRILDGFTYSEYARKGFSELNILAIFSLFLYIGISLISSRTTKKENKFFSFMSVTLMMLVGIILLSSYYRLQLYEVAFGFTRLRTYTHVYIIWLALLLFTTTGLEISKNQKYLTLSFLITLMGFIVTLNILNVDSFIVRKNIERANVLNQSDKINLQSQMLDIGHLSSLSQDALPALFEFSSKYEGGYLNTALACFVYQHNNFEPYGYSRNDTWQSFHYSKYVSMAIWNQIQQSESLTIPNVMFGEGYYSPYIMFENEKIYCWNNYFD